jgi:hypothetical protein
MQMHCGKVVRNVFAPRFEQFQSVRAERFEREKPFALSLSKGIACGATGFDKLSPNGGQIKPSSLSALSERNRSP